MYTPQELTVEDNRITILRNDVEEVHEFSTSQEAKTRAKFINEAVTWIGTPFRDCADVKGVHGAVDCAMLLVRCAVDTGILAPFDPRPYPPRWHLHRSEEKFIGWVRDNLGGIEVETPNVGDIVIWQFGRCYSHGAILINNEEVVHAYYAAGMCLVSRIDEAVLKYISIGRFNFPRPVKYFDIWVGR